MFLFVSDAFPDLTRSTKSNLSKEDISTLYLDTREKKEEKLVFDRHVFYLCLFLAIDVNCWKNSWTVDKCAGYH